jgi:RNA polymerase sigma factor (sigma-70 family)
MTPDSHYTSLVLLPDLKADDRAAWEDFAARYLHRMRALARQCGCQADAEDLVQEWFIRVKKAVGQFVRDSEGAFRAWLGQIVRNLARDLQRKTGRSKPVEGQVADELADGRPAPGEEAEWHEVGTYVLARVRNAVSAESWATFERELRFVQGEESRPALTDAERQQLRRVRGLVTEELRDLLWIEGR